MKKEYTFSIKRRIMGILLGTLVPVIVFLIFYNLYVINVSNDNLAAANASALHLYCSKVEQSLERTKVHIVNIVANNSDFRQLAFKDANSINVHLHAYNILQKYQDIMNSEKSICAFLIFSLPNGIYRGAYSDAIQGYEIKSAMMEEFKNALNSGKKVTTKVWQPCVIQEKNYIYMCLSYGSAYCVCLMNPDAFDLPQNTDPKDTFDNEKTDAKVIFLDQGQPLNEDSVIRDNDIEFKGRDEYYFSGTEHRYMILESDIQGGDFSAAYLYLYQGFQENLNHSQYLLFAGSMMTMILILVGYFLLKRTFFQPVDRMMTTMEKIWKRTDGELESYMTPDTAYPEIEFRKVNSTFNHMLQEIRHLKISAYENQLDLQNIKLQYYQIQVRPHFFLNCLKNIYGMVEEENYANIQKMIIYLSRHLRYMMREDSGLVTVSEELQYVQNYINLQEICMRYPPVCHIKVDAKDLSWKIPGVSILSFVENSVKYFSGQTEQLQIDLSISELPSSQGRLFNIKIHDNGQGFSEEQLEEYNLGKNNGDSGHIGIHNVIQRFILYYGKEKVGFIFSNNHGADVEILIQLDRKEDWHNEYHSH